MDISFRMQLDEVPHSCMSLITEEREVFPEYAWTCIWTVLIQCYKHEWLNHNLLVVTNSNALIRVRAGDVLTWEEGCKLDEESHALLPGLSLWRATLQQQPAHECGHLSHLQTSRWEREKDDRNGTPVGKKGRWKKSGQEGEKVEDSRTLECCFTSPVPEPAYH